MAETLSRDVPIEPGQTALLFIDVQNFGAARNGGEYADIPEAEGPELARRTRHDDHLAACRARGEMLATRSALQVQQRALTTHR